MANPPRSSAHRDRPARWKLALSPTISPTITPQSVANAIYMSIGAIVPVESSEITPVSTGFLVPRILEGPTTKTLSGTQTAENQSQCRDRSTVRSVKHSFPKNKHPARERFWVTCIMIVDAPMRNLPGITRYLNDIDSRPTTP